MGHAQTVAETASLELQHELNVALAELIPSSTGSLKSIRAKSSVLDGGSLYRVADLYVVHVSPPGFPNVAAEQAQDMRAAKKHLGALGNVILDILFEGDVGGRSFLVVPQARPLSGNRFIFAWQRRKVRKLILAWLRGVASLAAAPSPNTREAFLAALEALSGEGTLPVMLRDEAHNYAQRVRSNEVTPRFVLMHTDLWKANVLQSRHFPLIIIDWRGSRVNGFGIYDLIRTAQSFRVPQSQLKSELAEHARLLGVDASATMMHLLAALGHILINIDQFPMDRFVHLAESCYHDLSAALR